ncbi:hypothetical protein FPV67DRAFT_38451 [Lyophyllum atratum]|nr:hypothetical protein FPV67DRAFT_38451 [Lyophyllum atratum]
MRRRAPPTSLRLVQGPTPPRNAPKHTLPSVPRPAFHPTPAAKQTAPIRSRSQSFLLPCLDMAGSATTLESDVYPRSAVITKVRGPWDHSGCIAVEFDVENVLAPLKPVAISL